MKLAAYPKQTSWQIIYKGNSPIIRRAVEFLSREAGKLIIRFESHYSLYVLPTEEEGTEIRQNAMIIGIYEDSPLIQSLVKAEDVPRNGHCYKVIKSPSNPDARYAIMTGHTPQEVYAAAVDFVDRYPCDYSPTHGSLRLCDQIFAEEMKEGAYSVATKSPTRGIFTWGFPINDYRQYIKNMARLKLNQLILWNDFVPFNAKEIIDYAHSFGIEIIWGYSWGWDVTPENLKPETLKALKEDAIKTYEESYRPIGCDGIYFQSFTETHNADIGGILIADAVTDFVNDTVAALLEKYPDMRIQFGLHASSVLDHLDSIAGVDKRVEIIWEDYGPFPSGYTPRTNEEEFSKLIETTEKLINLRGDAPLGLITKGFMMLDWDKDRFIHQKGRFVMGDNDEFICEHDRRVRHASWRMTSADVVKYGSYMQRFVKFVTEVGGGRVNLCMAGTFDGGIYFPVDLTATLFYNPAGEYSDFVSDSLRKDFVTLA